jgi:hypothetical protein
MIYKQSSLCFTEYGKTVCSVVMKLIRDESIDLPQTLKPVRP